LSLPPKRARRSWTRSARTISRCARRSDLSSSRRFVDVRTCQGIPVDARLTESTAPQILVATRVGRSVLGHRLGLFAEGRHLSAGDLETGRRCNPVQAATAFLAFTATLAMWNLQLTDSKRILSGSNPTLSAKHTSNLMAFPAMDERNPRAKPYERGSISSSVGAKRNRATWRGRLASICARKSAVRCSAVLELNAIRRF
jgi:hypothetical protein